MFAALKWEATSVEALILLTSSFLIITVTVIDVALCLKMCEQDVQMQFGNKGKINLHASWGELLFYFWVRGRLSIVNS